MLPPLAPCSAPADTNTSLNPSARDKVCRAMEETLEACMSGIENSFRPGLFHLNICNESCDVFPSGKPGSLGLGGCGFGSA